MSAVCSEAHTRLRPGGPNGVSGSKEGGDNEYLLDAYKIVFHGNQARHIWEYSLSHRMQTLPSYRYLPLLFSQSIGLNDVKMHGEA